MGLEPTTSENMSQRFIPNEASGQTDALTHWKVNGLIDSEEEIHSHHEQRERILLVVSLALDNPRPCA